MQYSGDFDGRDRMWKDELNNFHVQTDGEEFGCNQYGSCQGMNFSSQLSFMSKLLSNVQYSIILDIFFWVAF